MRNPLNVNNEPTMRSSSWPRPMRNRISALLATRTLVGSTQWTKIVVALIVVTSFGLGSLCLASAQSVPSGTIELSGGSVAVGVGYTWAKGELIYEGRRHPLKVSGISILQLGASSYTASGTVYDLHKLSDINGIYTAVSAGVAIAGGASATAMKNDKGVVIQMTSTHQGLNFSLGAKGVTISLR